MVNWGSEEPGRKRVKSGERVGENRVESGEESGGKRVKAGRKRAGRVGVEECGRRVEKRSAREKK